MRLSRAQTEAEKAHYAQLYDFAPAVYVTLDRRGTVLQTNRAGARLLGLEGPPSPGLRFDAFVAPSDQSGFSAFLQRAFASQPHPACEVELVSKDRSPLAVQVEAAISPDGDQCLIIATDITKRKQAEKRLRDSEARYRELHESLFDAYARVDLDGRIEECNPAYQNMLGYTADELSRKTYKELTPEKWHALEARILQEQTLPLGHSDVYEKEYRRKDGTVFPVELRTFLIRDAEGHPSAMWAIVRDITRRKQMQDAAEKRILALTRPLTHDAAIRFDELFDLADIQRIQDEFAAATGVASIITRPDGTPITRPSHFTRLCSEIVRKTEKGCANCFKSDAVLGKPHPGGPIVQPCLSGGLWDAGASINVGGHHIANWLIGQVRNECQTEEAMREYARLIGADETEFIKAFRDVPSMTREQFQRVAQALYTLANQISTTAYQNVLQARFIAEIKRNEVERERLMAAIEQSSEVILITDPQGAIQYVNPAFTRVTGFTREEAAGRFPNILKSGLQDDAFYHELWQTITGGKTWSGRIVNQRKDGALYTEDMTISPVRDQEGRIVNYVAVKRDITDYLKIAAQLQQAQKMESIGRLAGGVAHDFNNMLSVILGNTELALNGLDPGHPHFVELQEIRKAASHSADLTRQLLAFARKQTVIPKVLDLNATVEGMLKMLRRLIGEDIELAWRPEPRETTVKIDPAQIDQMLANLAVNARDAIAGAGRLTIETALTAFDQAFCADHADAVPGEYVMLAVSDNGCGMDKATREHLFEPFFTTKGLGEGTGLGLATVYGIVQQNRGFIEFDSAPGQGTTFRIYLPRCLDKAKPSPAAAPKASAGHGHETVLLVEDEPALLNMGKRMLESLGYRVLEAGTPAAAIAAAEQHVGEIHLLLTDVIMPGMSGRDLSNQMRSRRPHIKCLFMSGYTANAIAHQGLLSADVFFIQKPFSTSDLAAKVAEALDSP